MKRRSARALPLDLFAPPPDVPGRGKSERVREASISPSPDGIPSRASAASEWSVSEANAAARQLIEGGLPPLWISGEVTNFTRARSGHCYFTLRDDRAQIRCVMWRDEARRLPTSPSEGMEVRALGRLTLYEGRGEFQFAVSDLEGRGDGLWRLAFERLRSQLDAEGLTAIGRKRPLPSHPACVGVVTSPTGAVLHDVVSVIRRRAPWTRVVLSGCRVQGEGAAEEIAAAIRRLTRMQCADVVIVGRGGGSVEDLWAFNEEVVARAVAESPVPVVSAVGHETDFTIADLVADLRAPTPSAAAESCVPDGAALRRDLGSMASRLEDAISASLRERRSMLDHRQAQIERAADLTRGPRERTSALAGRLHALSPLGAMARGFALPQREGRLLRRVKDFRPGRDFELRVVDGRVRCRVDSVQDLPRASGAE